MWHHFLHLLAAARRPLVILDFETAGLSGAPPVEFALAYWAPWCEPADDETSTRARALCPAGLTYAASWRLDPGVPIHPEATVVHGIRDEDVRGKARSYKDLELVSLFQGLATGSPADNEAPAVFVGHNAAEADVPWARSWGYLPADVIVVDTMRMQRRLGREHPFPLSPDGIGLGGPWAATTLYGGHCPVIGHGLKPYASNLEGLHTAMFGDPAQGGHGALSDICATVRCLAAMLELWSPLYSTACPDRDSADDLLRIAAALDAPPPGQLGWDGWLATRTPVTPAGGGVQTWGKKARKYTGQPITVDRSYAKWVCGLPSSPTGIDGEAWCSPTTADILHRMLG